MSTEHVDTFYGALWLWKSKMLIFHTYTHRTHGPTV
jgi:hypothetical protein